MKRVLPDTLLLHVLLIIFLFPQRGDAQPYNKSSGFLKANGVWSFGNKSGLNFNGAGTTTFTSGAYGNEGAASVADQQTGELLFYTDGNRCWNKDHQVMPNGFAMLGNGLGSTSHSQWDIYSISTTQGACIVPMPGQPGKYYIFSLNNGSIIEPSGSLFYSVVDMSLDNGLGDLVTSEKNKVLSRDSLSESMIAIPGDSCDLWLVVHDFINPVFRSYHITANGIDTVPVLSTTGTQIQGSNPDRTAGAYFMGAMAVSSDRQRIAITSYIDNVTPDREGLLLCKFNAATGVVSDAIQVVQGKTNYVPAFSPDNSRLYATTSLTDAYSRSVLYQYTITSFDATAITNSKVAIDTLANAFTYLRLYNDTIYANIWTYSSPYFTTLSRINNPNVQGVGCSYQKDAITLTTGTSTYMSLPNDVVFPLPMEPVRSLFVDTVICRIETDSFTLTPKIVSSEYTYSWNSGTTDAVLKVNSNDTYWVAYNDGCRFFVDTFLLRASDIFTTISVNGFELGTTGGPFTTYQWYHDGNLIPGATAATYSADTNGDYQVLVTDKNGCEYLSAVYSLSNVSVANTTWAAHIHIYPNPVADIITINAPVKLDAVLLGLDGRTIGTYINVEKITLGNLPAGSYFLHLSDKSGKRVKVEKLFKY